MKASLLLEVHGWRGFHKEKDLFCVHVVCGFFTLVVCKMSVMDNLKEFRERLNEIRKRLGGEE